MYRKKMVLLCALVTVINGYAFDESEGQLRFLDFSPAEEQRLERLGQACDEFVQQRAASFNQRTLVVEDRLNNLKKQINEIELSVQATNNRLDTADRILKFFILPMAASTIAAVGAFEATEWYNKKYQKTLNKYVIAAAAGGSAAAIIFLAVWSVSK